MNKMAGTLYGVVAYLVFFATFLYLIGFVTNLVVPKSIDSGVAGDVSTAVVVNLLLVALFGLQHSVMARKGFKAWWTRIVPKPIERSTYVLAACLALILLFVLWRPIPGLVWKVGGVWAGGLWALCGLGWAMVLASSWLIDHFELFGVRQVLAHQSGKALPAPTFKTPGFYRAVRHPLYVGFLLGFWAAPTMSFGHLLFAAANTLYILIAIRFEERDLIALFGERYRDYQRRVSMIVPWFPRRGT